MRALIVTRYGGPEVLRFEEVLKPVPRSKEVLIKIEATTISSADWRIRSRTFPRGFGMLGRLAFGFSAPRRNILGSELAGTIEAVGSAVTKFKVGDPVFAFSDTSLGAHAEYKVMAEDGAIAPKPQQLSFAQAAALSFGGTTALAFLRAGQAGPGQRILINGASGAVGTAAVQLAKSMGAEVTAVCSTRHLSLVKSIGADFAVDYTRSEPPSWGNSYDVLMDCVGALNFTHAQQLLKPRGRFLMVAASLPEMLQIPWVSFSSGRKAISTMALGKAEDLRLLAQLAAEGKFTPVVDRSFSFDAMIEAHRYVDQGHKQGNVLVIFSQTTR